MQSSTAKKANECPTRNGLDLCCVPGSWRPQQRRRGGGSAASPAHLSVAWRESGMSREIHAYIDVSRVRQVEAKPEPQQVRLLVPAVPGCPTGAAIHINVAKHAYTAPPNDTVFQKYSERE